MRLLLVAALLVAVVATVSSLASAAYIRLDTSKPVCFVEEVTYGSELIIFQYTRKMFQSTNQATVRLTVTSPLTKKLVYSRELRDQASQILTFSPIADELGEYKICLMNLNADATLATGQGVQLEILIDHQDRRMPLSSAQAQPAAALRRKEKDEEVFMFSDAGGQVVEALRTHDYLDRVQRNLDQMDKIIDEVTQETLYFKKRQARMRITSESSFTRVWGFSVLIISMVVIVSLMQYFSLRSFLREKKLV